MEKIRIDEIENEVKPAAVMRNLTEPLGSTDFAMNYYELEAGDSFSFAYHNHEIQEEVFYVQEGTATFETDSGPVDVAGGEVIRFDREEFQRGWNRGDVRVIALAFGAPLKAGTRIKLRICESCGERTDNRLEVLEEGGREIVVAFCKECDRETGRWRRGSMDGRAP